MKSPYLTGDRVYLRPLVMDDKDRASAWFDSPFPVGSSRAEEVLKEEHKNPWYLGQTTRLAIVRRENDEVVGGATVEPHGERRAWLLFTMARCVDEADALRADALRAAIRWLRDDFEMMVTIVPIAADEEATIAAAEALEMVPGVRLREFRARPGGRVDLLYYQALNPRWEVRDGDA